MLTGLLLALFILTCFLIVAIILIQTGQESGFAGAFGAGGGGQTVFGARAGTFLTRITAGLAAAFMILAFLLVLVGSRGAKAPEEVPIPEELPAPVSEEVPAGADVQPATGASAAETAAAPSQTSGEQ